jgi:DNA-binding MltR family transcriptional regulator
MGKRNQIETNSQHLIEMFISLMHESDRGAVLILTCFLDNQLEKLHETYIELNASSKLGASLLSYPQPLSTFAARIKLAHAYGLIDSDIYTDLEKIREIRNDCAHSIGSFSFSKASTKAQALSLKLGHAIVAKRLPELKPIFDAITKDLKVTNYSADAYPRIHFEFSCQEVGFRILEATTNILKAEIQKRQKKQHKAT